MLTIQDDGGNGAMCYHRCVVVAGLGVSHTKNDNGKNSGSSKNSKTAAKTMKVEDARRVNVRAQQD